MTKHAPLPQPHTNLFADLPPDPANHFRVHLFGAILRLLGLAATGYGTFEKLGRRFPFLAPYHNELADRVPGLSAAEAFDRWCVDLETWESRALGHLPLRAIRLAARAQSAEVCVLLCLGLTDEDSRFGDLIEALHGQPGQRRPTFALLRRLWPSGSATDRAPELVAVWRALGCVDLPNPDAPRPDWLPQIPSSVWDAFRGSVQPADEGLDFRPSHELADLETLILPPSAEALTRGLPGLLETGEARAVILRGPRHNGRRTLAGALARALARGVIEFHPDTPSDPNRWRRAAALGLALHALPVAIFDLAPGETVALPETWPASLPLAVVTGRQGGLSGSLADDAVTVSLELPDLATRTRHWSAALAFAQPEAAAPLAGTLRLGSGNIRRLARLARTRARLAHRDQPDPDDLFAAARSLNREALDALARHLPTDGDLGELHLAETTWQELDLLEQRCRHRESLERHLAAVPGGSPGCGIRALFSGPSGTGKTLAARILARRLRKDLYRLDLSAVVNKYIGETEKNLNRVFDRAEDLDVLLLLDEGDALLTRRTDVQTANDRYANLETNFLLQRLESFQGIVLITTNARERIDSAFERRLDVIVEFFPPDADERWALWQAHLSLDSDHDPQGLREIAARCQLTGGQIRNAALHATLLALDQGGRVTPDTLDAAVRREYRKRGAVCPLRGERPRPA